MSETEHEELLALYDWSVSELAEFRGRQWQTVNGVVLLNAALVAATKFVYVGPPFRTWAFGMLVLLSLLATGFGLYILWRLNDALALRADRMDLIRNTIFTGLFREAWMRKGPFDETVEVFKFVVGLGGLLAIGLQILEYCH